MSVRLNKINALLKEELSLIFLHKLQDPAIGLITITGVKVSPDLKVAKVYVSVYDKGLREDILNKLTDLRGLIRGQLAQRVRNIRRMPELNFYIDDTLDYVEKIENIFREIHKDDNKQDE
ncbi:MAG: 30S ribosome-binding factor RbfA [Bacteroidetes bacterium]|jgi:ribosome-binding factor A|nr:30S ribosome-binding factor RbfA [Bacteroidota bacterium]